MCLRLLGLAAGVAALVVVATSLASASFSDAAGDANEAPDITSVTVSESSGGGTVTVRVKVGNFDILPVNSGIFILFDLDLSASTGADGDEAVVRFTSAGTLDFLRWNGTQLVAASPSGMTFGFSAGVLTFTVDRAELAGAGAFGIAAVASRTQMVGGASVVATDFAPVGNRSVYSSPGELSFPDPEDDEDVAPDISEISTSDARNGMVTFRITTSNYPTLSEDKLIGLGFDLLGRPSSDDDVFLTYQGGSGTLDIEREVNGFVTQDTPPNRVSATYADGVFALSVHRSELDNVAAFRFGVVSADLTGAGEGEGQDAEGDIEAVDYAPDGVLTGELYSYKLVNPPPVRLTVGRVQGVPVSPRSGKPFTVSVEVTRSDTGKTVRSGSVSCAASVGSARVPASGRFRNGKARCSLVVPAGKRSLRVRGTMTIRAAGASVRSSFSFVVR